MTALMRSYAMYVCEIVSNFFLFDSFYVKYNQIYLI